MGAFTTIHDRLKADFNVKKERFVLLKLNSNETLSCWNDFIDKIKDGVLTSYTNQLIQFDEDSRRLDLVRLLPGWNYCQYFLLKVCFSKFELFKEGLASAHELMTLYDDSLAIYVNMFTLAFTRRMSLSIISFKQFRVIQYKFCSREIETGVPWFGTFGGTEQDDSTADLVNISRKPYREKFQTNTLTLFDFRIYLFTRQIQLLYKSNRPLQICHRAKKFIIDFAQTISLNKTSLHHYFRESWLYFSITKLMVHVDELVAVSNFMESQGYEEIKAELLYIARKQLDILGVAFGLLPNTVKINQQEFEGEITLEKSLSPEHLQNSNLKSALSNLSEFDILYAVNNELYFFIRVANTSSH